MLVRPYPPLDSRPNPYARGRERGIAANEDRWLAYLPREINHIIGQLVARDIDSTPTSQRNIATNMLLPLLAPLWQQSKNIRQDRSRRLFRKHFATNNYFAQQCCDYRGNIDWGWAYQAATGLANQTIPFLQLLDREIGENASSAMCDLSLARTQHMDVMYNRAINDVFVRPVDTIVSRLAIIKRETGEILAAYHENFDSTDDPRVAQLNVDISLDVELEYSVDEFFSAEFNHPYTFYQYALTRRRLTRDQFEPGAIILAALITDDVNVLRLELRLAHPEMTEEEIEIKLLATIASGSNEVAVHDLINMFEYYMARANESAKKEFLDEMADGNIYNPVFPRDQFRVLDAFVNRYNRKMQLRGVRRDTTPYCDNQLLFKSIDMSQYLGPCDYSYRTDSRSPWNLVKFYYQWPGPRGTDRFEQWIHCFIIGKSRDPSGGLVALADSIRVEIKRMLTKQPDFPKWGDVNHSFGLFTQWSCIHTLLPYERATDPTFRPALNYILNKLLVEEPPGTMLLSVPTLYLFFTMYYYSCNRLPVLPFRIYSSGISGSLLFAFPTEILICKYLPDSVRLGPLHDETTWHYQLEPVTHVRLVIFDNGIMSGLTPECYVENLIAIRPGLYLQPRNTSASIMANVVVVVIDYDIDDTAWFLRTCGRNLVAAE